MNACEICGKQFTPRPNYLRQKYCGYQCRRFHRREYEKKYRETNPNRNKKQRPKITHGGAVEKRVTLNCLKCGKPFRSRDNIMNRICEICNIQNLVITRTHDMEACLYDVG